MIVYTAGPYTAKDGVGSVNDNIARARDVAVQLWGAGYTVICPHMNTAHMELYTNLTSEQFVDKDLELVKASQAIVMLPYWEQSRGAVRELECARLFGLQVWFWPNVPGVQKSSAAWKDVKEFFKSVFEDGGIKEWLSL